MKHPGKLIALILCVIVLLVVGSVIADAVYQDHVTDKVRHEIATGLKQAKTGAQALMWCDEHGYNAGWTVYADAQKNVVSDHRTIAARKWVPTIYSGVEVRLTIECDDHDSITNISDDFFVYSL
jgi:hypothetical protein